LLTFFDVGDPADDGWRDARAHCAATVLFRIGTEGQKVLTGRSRRPAMCGQEELFA